jgi:hypothetical protein
VIAKRQIHSEFGGQCIAPARKFQFFFFPKFQYEISRLDPVYRIMSYLLKAGFCELFDDAICVLENISKDEVFLLARNHVSYFDPTFLDTLLWKQEFFSFAKRT